MKLIQTAEILCVGTELLIGDIVNTNAATLARGLASLGINVYHQSVVGDHPERLTKALQTALSRADLVITSGGLGPTYDDITRETAAAVMGCPLSFDGFLV
jgi:nicotinamide-nucleotide amidase